jgi:hypothetical protein
MRHRPGVWGTVCSEAEASNSGCDDVPEASPLASHRSAMRHRKPTPGPMLRRPGKRALNSSDLETPRKLRPGCGQPSFSVRRREAADMFETIVCSPPGAERTRTAVLQISADVRSCCRSPLVTPAARVDSHRAVPHEIHDPHSGSTSVPGSISPDAAAPKRDTPAASRRGCGDRRDLRPLRAHRCRQHSMPVQDSVRRDRGKTASQRGGGTSPGDWDRSSWAATPESGGVKRSCPRHTTA